MKKENRDELINDINKALLEVSRRHLYLYSGSLLENKKERTNIKNIKKRKPSEYNLRVKEIKKENPSMSMKDVFKMAAKK